MRLGSWLVAVEGVVHGWFVRHSIMVLRVSLGAVFLGFGLLKYFPGVSPAQDLAVTTTRLLTFGLVPDGVALLIIATLECGIGLSLITGKGLRLTVYLLAAELVGILSPLVLLPARLFAGPFQAPTLEGQYVLKDFILVAAAMVIATTFRGARIAFSDPLRPDEAAPRHRRPVTAAEKLAVVLSGVRGEYAVRTLCRRHGITNGDYLSWRRSAMEGAMTSLAVSAPASTGAAHRH